MQSEYLNLKYIKFIVIILKKFNINIHMEKLESSNLKSDKIGDIHRLTKLLYTLQLFTNILSMLLPTGKWSSQSKDVYD